MEVLFAYAYLWAFGFCSGQEYNVYLDEMFLNTPDDEVMLELEECSSNYKETLAKLKRYFEYEANPFDSSKFGKSLFNGLEAAYKSNAYNMAEFGSRCYELYMMLPGVLEQEQPFCRLCYADDPLSWGDEEQSRILYEEAFTFYKK